MPPCGTCAVCGACRDGNTHGEGSMRVVPACIRCDGQPCTTACGLLRAAGKGVSSSAALEVSVMSAVAAAHDIQLGGRELALLCQKVEVSCLLPAECVCV